MFRPKCLVDGARTGVINVLVFLFTGERSMILFFFHRGKIIVIHTEIPLQKSLLSAESTAISAS